MKDFAKSTQSSSAEVQLSCLSCMFMDGASDPKGSKHSVDYTLSIVLKGLNYCLTKKKFSTGFPVSSHSRNICMVRLKGDPKVVSVTTDLHRMSINRPDIHPLLSTNSTDSGNVSIQHNSV